MLSDSRAKALIVSEALLPQLAPLLGKLPFLEHVIVSGSDAKNHLPFGGIVARGNPQLQAASHHARRRLLSGCIPPGRPGRRRAPCTCTRAWRSTAELYAKGILGIERVGHGVLRTPSCISPTAWATR